MFRKAVSKTTILSIIALIVIIIIFFSLTMNFLKKVKKTEETSSVNKCKLPGTNNYCCKLYTGNEIPPKKGGWSDCQEPESACCIG